MGQDDTSVTVEWGEEDLSTLTARLKVDPKREAANTFAHCILAVFGIALLIILGCGSVIVIGRSPEEAGQTITKAFLPFLQGTASFWSTIFGPPLWMILGYFFARENNKNSNQRGGS